MTGPPRQGLSPRAKELVEKGDLDLLTSHANELVTERSWDQLELLREHCRSALQRGKQLWAVSAYIEYRFCLDGPGKWAAHALEMASGRFTLGPLPEVAAGTHKWAELSPYLGGTPQGAMAAHERVLRGDDLSDDKVAGGMPQILDLPLRLAEWEPHYELAEYEPDKLSAPSPRLAPLVPVVSPSVPTTSANPPTGGDPGVLVALEDLAATWANESNGRVEAVAVRGHALDAVRALGAPAVAIVELPVATAISWMAWAAASGGAHGRRRGAAAGRFGAWAVLAALAGVWEDWPRNEKVLGEVAESTHWYAWGAGEPATGWTLNLALETGPPASRTAYAVVAADAY